MNTFQASQANPTIEEIKEWGIDELLKWIQQKRPKLPMGNQSKKFKTACITGEVFLNHAGDKEFFENGCKLPIGISETLANLAMEIAGRKTVGMKSKLLMHTM